MSHTASETDSLLPKSGPSASNGRAHFLSRERLRRSRSSVLAVGLFSIVVFLLTWGVVLEGFKHPFGFGRGAAPTQLPKDPLERAKALLDKHPLIDGVSRDKLDRHLQTRPTYLTSIFMTTL